MEARAKGINEAFKRKFGDRDPERIERLLGIIRDIWLKPENQDMRLMQLLINPLQQAHILYNLEDSELEQKLRKLYKV